MSVHKFKDVHEFLSQSKSILYKKEAEYNLLLGLAEFRAKNAQVEDKNIYLQIGDAYAMATDKNIIISAMSSSKIKELVDYLNQHQIKVPGVVGPSIESETFAQVYGKLNNLNYRIAMDQKIYQLDQIIPARPTDGYLKVVNDEYLDIYSDWFLKFIEEALPNEPSTLEEGRKFMAHKIARQDLFVWFNAAGKPVALNMTNRPTENGVAISFVYTPKEERGKGYASAVVAETSQRMFDSGKKFCMLYTDVTNPTSNGVYQKIGYKEIATSKNFIFQK